MPRKAKEEPTIYTKKICKEWSLNPLYNPLVKKKHVLNPNKGVYQKLQRNCKKLHNIEVKLTEGEKEGNIKPKEHTITPEQCKELKKNPRKNPLTGRTIDPKALNGIYKKLIQECKEIQQELEKDAKPSAPEYMSTKITSKDKLRLQRMRLKNALRRALQPILHNRDSLENRIHYAKVVRTYGEMIQPCIQSSIEKRDKLVMVKQYSGIKPVEKIYFDKRIGSESVYGTAYMNAGKGFAKLLKFSAKVMGDQFSDEVYLLRRMSDLAEKQITPNMPITYDVLHCRVPSKDKVLKKMVDVPELVLNGRYYVVLNELANGDMHTWFKYTYTPQEYESVILQLLFSLRAFHKYTNCVHNDTHLGNFLWHKITPGGFWHYQYKSTSPPPPGFPAKQVQDIFVPNTGYLVVLWDPGLARRLSTNTLDPYHPTRDYLRPLNLIQQMNRIQMYMDKGMKPVPTTSFIPFERIINYLSSYQSRDVFMDYICDRKDKYFKHIYFDKNKLPANAQIINEIPYQL